MSENAKKVNLLEIDSMIESGDKNVNVVDIINKVKNVEVPTNDGVHITANEPYVEYPRDKRERIPLTVIDNDCESKLAAQIVEEDICTRVKELETIAEDVVDPEIEVNNF